MLTGHISNTNPLPLPKALRVALDFLRYTNLLELDVGVHQILNKKILVQVIDTKTKNKEDCPLESHRRYVDIQFLAKGQEKIGYAHDIALYEIKESKLKERDIIFYNYVENESFLEMTEGTYAIFFPHDIHRPAINLKDNCPCNIRKIVIKVDVNLLNEDDYE